VPKRVKQPRAYGERRIVVLQSARVGRWLFATSNLKTDRAIHGRTPRSQEALATHEGEGHADWPQLSKHIKWERRCRARAQGVGGGRYCRYHYHGAAVSQQRVGLEHQGRVASMEAGDILDVWRPNGRGGKGVDECALS
jgi:hypothetical protein